MLFKKRDPKDSHEQLTKEKKKWLIRESRADGMLTIDYVKQRDNGEIEKDSCRFALLTKKGSDKLKFEQEGWQVIPGEDVPKLIAMDNFVPAIYAQNFVKDLFFAVFKQGFILDDLLAPTHNEKIKNSSYYSKYIRLTADDVKKFYEEYCETKKLENNSATTTPQSSANVNSSSKLENVPSNSKNDPVSTMPQSTSMLFLRSALHGQNIRYKGLSRSPEHASQLKTPVELVANPEESGVVLEKLKELTEIQFKYSGSTTRLAFSTDLRSDPFNSEEAESINNRLVELYEAEIINFEKKIDEDSNKITFVIIGIDPEKIKDFSLSALSNQ